MREKNIIVLQQFRNLIRERQRVKEQAGITAVVPEFRYVWNQKEETADDKQRGRKPGA